MLTIAEVAQTVSILAACWAIVAGIGAWKREFVGKRKIELAELLLAKYYEICDSIAVIRSPLASADEGSSRQHGLHESREETEFLNRGFIVFERYQKDTAIFAEFKALKYRTMASFGKDAELIFSTTTHILNSIFISAQMLSDHYWPRQGRVQMDPQEAEDHLLEMQHHQKIFWDHLNPEDTVRVQLAEVQTKLDGLVKECFEEPARLYTLLTRRLKS